MLAPKLCSFLGMNFLKHLKGNSCAKESWL